MKPTPTARRAKAVVIAVLLLWTLLPIYWLLATSLKSPLATTANPPQWLPDLDISDNC